MIPPNVNGFYASLLVDTLVKHGVDTVGISPGSRSAPPALAVADHPDIDIRVIHDERASAFFAVGYARACGRPAAVITTSGTAVANLFPAVVEAYQSRLPMILLTADRPEELQDRGANQTIDQENIFGQYAAESVTLPAPDADSDPYAAMEAISFALNAGAAAPVQINCRFREPLAPVEEPYDFKWMSRRVDKWYLDHPQTAPQSTVPDLNRQIEAAAKVVNESPKCLLIAGPESPWRTSDKIMKLARRLDAPVCTDVLSNYRGDSDEHMIANYDLFLDSDAAAGLFPEVVIHIGGLPTSKRLQTFLRQSKHRASIRLQEHDRTIDPDRLETHRIVAPVGQSLDALIASVDMRKDTAYMKQWSHISRQCTDNLQEYFKKPDLTEASLMHALADLLPGSDALFFGNSMPVRDADSFLHSYTSDIIVGCNRGASGIDGTIASACGFASGSGRPTTVALGDLAFLHDLNSLEIASGSTVPVIIIVINNDGGGIFHHLPIAQHGDHFERCFATPHGLRFEKVANMFGISYHHVESSSDFRDKFQAARNNNRSTVLEVISDRRKNVQEHERIRSRIRQLLDTKG